MQILLKQLHRVPIELARLTGRFARSKWLPFLCELYVALHRSCAHPEGVSGLCLGHPAPNSGDDLLSEVYRVRFHDRMMHHRPTSPQHAVEAAESLGRRGEIPRED